jgi:hypothetical protein
MNRKDSIPYRCKRCNKPSEIDQLCQSCKNELLNNYEASCDWQTAFEIERATLTALRYRNESETEDETLY